MKRIFAFAFVFIFMLVCLCGCGANSIGLPHSGSVFPKGEVERAVLHCIPDSQVEVPAEHLQAIADWAQNFEYDKAIGSDLLEPGINAFSVTLFYADGSSHTSGIDIGCIGEKNYYIKREKPPVCWDVIWSMDNTERVEVSDGYANMVLELPEDWDYSYHGYSSEYGRMGISFISKTDREVICGLWFYPQFAMCGTGVTFEDVMVGGYTATRASELLQNGIFSVNYILHDLPGSYVLMVDVPHELWPQYEPKILSVLENAILAEGILSKGEAISIAQTECTIDYTVIDTRFSYGDGVWSVNFGQGTPGNDQTVFVDNYRNIVNIVYGE